MVKSKNYKRSILLVEDNNLNLRIMTRILQKMEVDVSDSTSDKEELIQAVQEKYSMIFVCVFMPTSVGCDATKLIRKHSAINKDTPIIAVSSLSDLKTNEELIHCGISDVLSKPLVEEELVALFQKYEVRKTPKRQHIKNNNKVFNINDFESFYSDDNLKQEIISIVMNERDSDLVRMNEAFDSKNKDIIYETVHYMKGSFTYLKADNILALTQEILDLLNNDELSQALLLRDSFISNYETLIEELSNYSSSFKR